MPFFMLQSELLPPFPFPLLLKIYQTSSNPCVFFQPLCLDILPAALWEMIQFHWNLWKQINYYLWIMCYCQVSVPDDIVNIGYSFIFWLAVCLVIFFSIKIRNTGSEKGWKTLLRSNLRHRPEKYDAMEPFSGRVLSWELHGGVVPTRSHRSARSVQPSRWLEAWTAFLVFN